MQTGAQTGNRPSMGAWLSYGLGSENKKSSCVLCVIIKEARGNGQGFILNCGRMDFWIMCIRGVQFAIVTERVLYLNDIQGMDRKDRQDQLDQLSKLNASSYQTFGDPEIKLKIEQYEMAYRMQTAVPELTDISHEPDSIVEDVRSLIVWCPVPM